MKNRFLSLAGIVAVLLVSLLVPVVWADSSGPSPATVTETATYTYYPETAVSGSTTFYSSAPRMVSGVDVSDVRKWNSIDVFASVDISSSDTVTITPQFSVDQTNWVDAYYTIDNGTAAKDIVYEMEFTSDGSDYVSVPVRGNYFRLKVEHGDTVTPTLISTLRNN